MPLQKSLGENDSLSRLSLFAVWRGSKCTSVLLKIRNYHARVSQQYNAKWNWNYASQKPKFDGIAFLMPQSVFARDRVNWCFMISEKVGTRPTSHYTRSYLRALNKIITVNRRCRHRCANNMSRQLWRATRKVQTISLAASHVLA
jgi:hypothetical protein